MAEMRELAEIALSTAKKAGASYADIRITRNLDQTIQARDRLIGGGSDRETYGFGVRTIVNGTWGFASSPDVTPEEIRRITLLSVEVGRASSLSKNEDVKLAPVPAYVDKWSTPIKIDPFKVPLTQKYDLLLSINERLLKQPGIVRATSNFNFVYEWKYFASSEGSFIEQEVYRTFRGYSAIASVNGVVKTRNYFVEPKAAGYEIVDAKDMLDNTERVAAEAVAHAKAKRVQPGHYDLVLKPSHAVLTVHEIVAHATELDRIVGYEANYAGTSFVTLDKIGKLKYGSKLFNVTADRTMPGGLATIGYDDDGVKSQRWPLIREGILVGVQTNRETAHYIGEKESRGCTFANHWRNFPFLRMPNVTVEPNMAEDAPTPDEIIADTKNGILIDGTGSFSIDQQRYNGQFGGDAFWEIKDGKITGNLADVTYQLITTDFWGNLDAVAGQKYWEAYGLGGDAKGQPIQTNYPTHGASWMRIRNVNVGGAQL